jgi:hypothetical protein
VLQGVFEKIQVQLLLTHQSLKLCDLSPRLRQVAHRRPRRPKVLRRQSVV